MYLSYMSDENGQMISLLFIGKADQQLADPADPKTWIRLCMDLDPPCQAS